MRFSMIIFFADETRRICLLEVVQKGASDTIVSDCNIPNENKHPKRFNSMENAAKSYSEVKSSKNSIISSGVILLPFSIHVTSHRLISLLTGKDSDLSGQWRMGKGRIAEAIQMKVTQLVLVLIRTWFRTYPVVKVLNQEFDFLIFLCLIKS